jgi:hypothetical protein
LTCAAATSVLAGLCQAYTPPGLPFDNAALSEKFNLYAEAIFSVYRLH